ncbi:MAG TPA: hypothetical protein PLL77_05920 [Pyrinomonadaceae bacterium]|nr:hypothetical protein [Pyrinomonadaceae bacterium]
MKLRLFCLSFISAVVVAGSLAFESTISNAEFGIKPLATATPRKVTNGSQPRTVKKTGAAQTAGTPTVPNVAGGDVNGDPSDARSSAPRSAATTKEFKPQSPESNGMIVTGTSVPASPDVNGAKSSATKYRRKRHPKPKH